MKKTTHEPAAAELLIQADGRILAHNLTPALARVLAKLNPYDRRMKRRAGSSGISRHEFSN